MQRQISRVGEGLNGLGRVGYRANKGSATVKEGDRVAQLVLERAS